MKKSLFLCLLFALPTTGFAAGLTQHEFMADVATKFLATPDLHACLSEYPDAHRIGAPFPDCGYASGARDLSNVAHSPAFIDAFVDYIMMTYPGAKTSQRKLLAFLMGVASHVADDPPYHNGFITECANQDFGGDYDTAHTYCDTGLEFIVIQDFNRWGDNPEFWIPVDDCVNVYASMGISANPDDIIFGNGLLNIAGLGERLITPIVYNGIKQAMPWGAFNYYYYFHGGLLDGARRSAAYYEHIWNRLTVRTAKNQQLTPPQLTFNHRVRNYERLHESDNPMYRFSRRCLNQDCVQIPVTYLPDGSVILGTPQITDIGGFIRLLEEVVREILR